MQEYVSEAVVLASRPNGEMDERFSLFTGRYGKLIVKGKSTRKLLSKLSAHLQPGNLVKVRLVEKRGLQVADALKYGRIKVSPTDLHFLDKILHEAEPDFSVWSVLVGEDFRWPKVLKILGWDPQQALCQSCNRNQPRVFYLKSQEFFCEACASKLERDGVVYL